MILGLAARIGAVNIVLLAACPGRWGQRLIGGCIWLAGLQADGSAFIRGTP